MISRCTGIVLFLSFTACSVNLLSSFANQQSDEALLTDATTLINQRSYSAALEKFPLMSTSYQNRRDVILLRATANAGAGGLDFLDLANDIQGIGSTSLFTFLMQSFRQGTAATMLSLKTAQTLIGTISSTTANLTNDELMASVMVNLAHMGNILSRYGDANNDGTVDAINPCNSTDIPEAASPNDSIQEFGASLNLAIAALDQLSTNGVSFGPASATAATTACTALTAGGFGAYAFCGITNPATFTANQLLGLRSIVNESTAGVGLGTCTGDIVTCRCF